jgi:hypothetical protein
MKKLPVGFVYFLSGIRPIFFPFAVLFTGAINRRDFRDYDNKSGAGQN